MNQGQEPELKRDSRIFKVAYGWKDQKLVPRTTNRCRLLWRAVLSAVFVWSLLGLLYGLLWFLIFVVGNVVSVVFFGSRSTSEGGYRSWHHFSWLPEVGGHKVWPGVAYALALFLWWVGRATPRVIETVGSWSVELGLSSLLALVIFAAIIVIYLLCYAVMWIGETAPWKFVADYSKAKKERVCPIIYIEQLPQEQEGS